MRYNHFDMLPERAFQRDVSGKIKPQGGGGTSSPSKSTVTQTNIPEYARPYAEETLGRAQALTDINQNPFQPYSDQRFAGFSPMQAQAFQNISQQQVSPQITDASNIAYTASGQALGAQPISQALQQTALGYGQAGAGYGGAASTLGIAGAQAAQLASQEAQRRAGMYGQMGAQAGRVGMEYGAQGAQQAGQVAGAAGQQAQMYGGLGAGYGGAATSMVPQAQMYGGTAAGLGLEGYGYGQQGAGIGGLGVQAAQQGFGAGQAYAQQATSPEAQQAYMSPYMQNVVKQQQEDARRQALISSQAEQAQAVKQGAFGGSRSAIVEAESRKNLEDRLAQIQATGSQQAFQQAQQAQQFGAGLGIQGLQAGYQGLQTGLAGTAQGMQGAQTGITGQQAGLAGLAQAGQLYGLGMTGAGLGLQGVGQQLAAGQLGLAGTAQGMQGAGLGIQGAQAGLQGVGQQIAGGQLGLQGTQAGIAGQQAGIQGAQAGMQGVGQAVGAGQYGLQGAQTAIQGAGQLGQLGQTQYAQQMGITDALQKYGALQQQQQQQALDFAYQQYLAQQQYPYQQLSYMSDILRGVPSTQSAVYQYQQQPAVAPQLLGAGLSAYGAFARGSKEGGQIKRYADGGQVTPDAMNTMAVQELPGKLRRLSDTQLAAYARNVKDAITLSAIQGELNRRTRSRAPMGQPQDTTLADDIAKRAQAASLGGPVGMAGGGIVALQRGGSPDDSENFGVGLDTAQSQYDAARNTYLGYGILDRKRDPEGFAAAEQGYNAARAALQNAKQQYSQSMAGSPTSAPALLPTAAARQAAAPQPAPELIDESAMGAPAQTRPPVPAAPDESGIAKLGQQNVPSADTSKPAPQAAPRTAPATTGSGIVSAGMFAKGIIPGSFEEYKAQINKAVQRGPEDQKVLDDMANRVKTRIERASKQEDTAKYDAIMMAGLAMMGGTSLADGIAKAAQMGGATYMQGRDKAAKAMEAAEEADLTFQKYKIALDRNDKKEAGDLFKDYSAQILKLQEIQSKYAEIGARSKEAAAARQTALEQKNEAGLRNSYAVISNNIARVESQLDTLQANKEKQLREQLLMADPKTKQEIQAQLATLSTTIEAEKRKRLAPMFEQQKSLAKQLGLPEPVGDLGGFTLKSVK